MFSVAAQAIPVQAVCLESVNPEEKREFCFKIDDVIFELFVPVGQYYAYAKLQQPFGSIGVDNRAYDTQFVRCGAKPECQDHSKIAFDVKIDETVEIKPQDWSELQRSVTPTTTMPQKDGPFPAQR